MTMNIDYGHDYVDHTKIESMASAPHSRGTSLVISKLKIGFILTWHLILYLPIIGNTTATSENLREIWLLVRCGGSF